jgi:hypothetical protein
VEERLIFRSYIPGVGLILTGATFLNLILT